MRWIPASGGPLLILSCHASGLCAEQGEFRRTAPDRIFVSK